MSTVATVTQIDTQILAYLPAVIAGTQAAQLSTASGATKLQAVINGILAGSAVEAGSSNVNVAAISSLINLVVAIFNATGVFNHTAKAPVAPTSTVTPSPVANTTTVATTK